MAYALTDFQVIISVGHKDIINTRNPTSQVLMKKLYSEKY